MRKKLSLEEAVRLSKVKWEYIVENFGSPDGLIEAIPELRELKANCGYCEYYLVQHPNPMHNCTNCPLAPENYDWEDEDTGCSYVHHLYRTWAFNSTTENAQKVLDMIINPTLHKDSHRDSRK